MATDIRKKVLDRQIAALIKETDRGQDADTLAGDVLERLNSEQRQHLVARMTLPLLQEWFEEKVAVGEFVDNGDGTYTKAV